MTEPDLSNPQNALQTAWRDGRAGLKGVLSASFVINLLLLAGPLFMLQVYDRVLTSRSLETLAVLTVGLGVLLIVQAWFDAQRARLVTRIALVIDGHLRGPVISLLVRASLAGAAPVDAARPARDLEQLRTFAAGPGPALAADLPWAPLFLGVCFLLHPWIGAVALGGAVLLLGAGLIANRVARSAEAALSREAVERANWTDAIRRNADTAAALGMEATLQSRLTQLSRAAYDKTVRRSLDRHGAAAAYSRALRLGLQSGVLALGAMLVIFDQMNVGAMIAASILTGRALQPAELLIGQWSSFVAARAAYGRLAVSLRALPPVTETLARPPPTKSLAVNDLTVVAPSGKIVLTGIKFALRAGDALAVVGPSASGKTSLAKALTGIWPAAGGTVRLDDVDLRSLDRAALARSLGYLAQDVGLFDTTIAANIARLEPNPDPHMVLAAAEAAAVAGIIERLPGAYDRSVGAHGSNLSAGERQRIGLARALYGNPFLVVLDEPNSNLDVRGEAALNQVLARLRARGAITIVIAHRPQVLQQCNKVLVLENGRQKAFGAREATLAAVREERRKRSVVPLRRPKSGASGASA